MTLEGNGLLPHHIANLRSSLISDAVATDRGYHSVTTPEELKRVGFGKIQQTLVPSLLIPIWDVYGKIVFHVIRPDHPRSRKPGKRPSKYEFPAGIHMAVDVPPSVRGLLGDPNTALWITEGSKKADAAVSHGLCCVSIIGVWNWRGTNKQGGTTALADWESIAFNDRLVYLAFDSDAMERKEVYGALGRAREFFARRGAHVRIVYLPPTKNGDKQGLDDYLANGGSVESAIATARDELLLPINRREPGDDELDASVQKLNLTDLGNARRLVRDHGRDIRYCPVWTSWLIWDGTRWKRDDTNEIQRRVRLIVASLYLEAAHARTVDAKEEISKHAIKSESHRSLEAAERVASAEPGVAVSVEEFDRSEWLFNAANGTVDLRTGLLQPHKREELLTKISAIAFDPEAKSPMWDAFLDRIMDGRKDLVDFLQRAAGYSLTGSVREQAMFFCFGQGANGKSTFIETMRFVCGDYSSAAKFDTFLSNENRSDAREDIARLRGARFVSAVEGPDGKRFDEAAIKQLTGGDTVTARFLYEGSFEFRPSCKIWLAANHKPTVSGEDDGIWRRMRLVPFTVAIPENERDGHLLEKLKGEAAGILAWSVRGALSWLTHGLGTPVSVVVATQEYRDDSDRLGLFITERCDNIPGQQTRSSELYKIYKTWSESRGEKPFSAMTFGLRLKNRREVNHLRDRNKVVWYQDIVPKCGYCG